MFPGRPTRRRAFLEEFEAPLSSVLGATAKEALLYSPLSSINRMGEMAEAESGSIDLGGFIRGEGLRGEPETPVVPADEARARIKEEGLDLTVPDDGIRHGALDILIRRKKDERRRRDILNRAPGGFAAGSARFATMLGASMLDPLNVAVSFIPVVGQARHASMLARAGSRMGRAGVRARVGAIEGAAGAAIIEPLVIGATSQEQADYGMMDSLLNVALGTVLGGGLHVGAGAAAEAIGKGAAWQRARATEELPRMLERMPMQARESALRTAVAQAMTGRRINVDAVLSPHMDTLRDSTAIPGMGGPMPEFRPTMQATSDSGAAVTRTLVPTTADNGPVVFASVVEAEKAIGRAGRRGAGEGLRVTEIGDGKAVLSRESDMEILRRPDGQPRTYDSQRAALRSIESIPAMQGRKLDVVAMDGRFGVVENATDAELAILRSAPETVQFPDVAGRRRAETMAEQQRRLAGTMERIKAAVKESFRPENHTLVDFEASVHASEKLKTAPGDEAMPETSLGEVMEDIQALARTLGDDELVSRELADFDALIETAESYGNAVRAAASCGLRRGAA